MRPHVNSTCSVGSSTSPRDPVANAADITEMVRGLIRYLNKPEQQRLWFAFQRPPSCFRSWRRRQSDVVPAGGEGVAFSQLGRSGRSDPDLAVALVRLSLVEPDQLGCDDEVLRRQPEAVGA
jgi:hypothetical protein